MQDLFNSAATRSNLIDIYCDTHVAVRGTEPDDYATLGRAGLVDRIERLLEEADSIPA
jgi:hypothetical protein